MELFRRFLGKHFNLRKEKRHSEIFGLSCRVIHNSTEEDFYVDVLDLSDNGMSFSTKKEKFEVGEKVQVVLSGDASEPIVHEGEILSQHIFYPKNSTDLEHAILRFSVRFFASPDAATREKLRKLIRSSDRPAA